MVRMRARGLGSPGVMRTIKNAESANVALKATVPGQYEARLDFAGPGLWLVELRLDPYRQSWEITVP